MQYVIGILWVAYIIYAITRAHRELCVGEAIRRMWKSLDAVEPGMTPEEVRSILGGPARVNANAETMIWQYRIDGRFKTVRFNGGKVEHRDDPPPQQAPEP